jgi:hypothetical protein
MVTTRAFMDDETTMLSRYKIYRGKRPALDPLPRGRRQDTRWRINHPLRPTQEIVELYLASPTDEAWQQFTDQYLALLEKRFSEDRAPFDTLAALASEDDVYLGCSCPTKNNPNKEHCHTYQALRFMKEKYPDLKVVSAKP